MILKLKDILLNPGRNLKKYPLNPEKIAELVASIHTTGFWDNVLVRKNTEGRYECGYGAHRIAAAIQAGLTEADFIVKDLSDEQMIKVLDNENRDIYRATPLNLMESVEAVVKGLAEGRVKAFIISEDVRKDAIRYAPSFVPGNVAVSSCHPYTAANIAQFLGRVQSNSANRIMPEDSIIAALNALHLMELGKLSNADMFKEKLVRAPEGKKATTVKVPLTTNELLTLTTEIKRDVETIQERRGKTQAELSKFREEQLELQRKQKEQKEAEEEKRKALLKREAEARRAENEAKADALAAKIKEADKRAQEKDALNKLRLQELDEKIAQKRAWEAEQKVQDSYASIRRDVESLIRTWETKVSERDAEREHVKSLAKLKALRPEDRLRLRKAAVAVADHYDNWVAAQFAPLPTDKEELKELAKREKEKNNAHR